MKYSCLDSVSSKQKERPEYAGHFSLSEVKEHTGPGRPGNATCLLVLPAFVAVCVPDVIGGGAGAAGGGGGGGASCLLVLPASVAVCVPDVVGGGASAGGGGGGGGGRAGATSTGRAPSTRWPG